MKYFLATTFTASFLLAGCTASKPEVSQDLTVALDVAASIEGAYAANPGSDPKKVAEVSRLLAVAEAAVASWKASSAPSDQALASAAIAALAEYEASANVKP